MRTFHIKVTTHWLNGWFLRAFTRPYIVVNSTEYSARFSRPIAIESDENTLVIGAGIRYFNRGALLGFKPEVFECDTPLPADAAVEITLQNGPWNHSPFRCLPS